MIVFRDDPKGTGDIFMRQEWAIVDGATTIGTCIRLADGSGFLVRLYDGGTGEGRTKDLAFKEAQEPAQ
jgi:hypothetical protein